MRVTVPKILLCTHLNILLDFLTSGNLVLIRCLLRFCFNSLEISTSISKFLLFLNLFYGLKDLDKVISIGRNLVHVAHFHILQAQKRSSKCAITVLLVVLSRAHLILRLAFSLRIPPDLTSRWVLSLGVDRRTWLFGPLYRYVFGIRLLIRLLEAWWLTLGLPIYVAWFWRQAVSIALFYINPWIAGSSGWKTLTWKLLILSLFLFLFLEEQLIKVIFGDTFEVNFACIKFWIHARQIVIFIGHFDTFLGSKVDVKIAWIAGVKDIMHVNRGWGLILEKVGVTVV